MKTRVQILQAIQQGKKSKCLDGRDFSRLANFFPVSDLGAFGFELAKGASAPPPEELTRENVLERLKSDIAFAFEKAIGKRGISSALMYEVVKMWLWVLDDPLEDFEEYSRYGLPLFKAVAIKYRFENPIGDDSGEEQCHIKI